MIAQKETQTPPLLSVSIPDQASTIQQSSSNTSVALSCAGFGWDQLERAESVVIQADQSQQQEGRLPLPVPASTKFTRHSAGAPRKDVDPEQACGHLLTPAAAPAPAPRAPAPAPMPAPAPGPNPVMTEAPRSVMVAEPRMGLPAPSITVGMAEGAPKFSEGTAGPSRQRNDAAQSPPPRDPQITVEQQQDLRSQELIQGDTNFEHQVNGRLYSQDLKIQQLETTLASLAELVGSMAKSLAELRDAPRPGPGQPPEPHRQSQFDP